MFAIGLAIVQTVLGAGCLFIVVMAVDKRLGRGDSAFIQWIIVGLILLSSHQVGVWLWKLVRFLLSSL